MSNCEIGDGFSNWINFIETPATEKDSPGIVRVREIHIVDISNQNRKQSDCVFHESVDPLKLCGSPTNYSAGVWGWRGGTGKVRGGVRMPGWGWVSHPFKLIFRETKTIPYPLFQIFQLVFQTFV